MKVMISIPMRGKTETQIRSEMDEIENKIKPYLNNAEFIDTLFKGEIPEEIGEQKIPIYLLGKAIEKLAKADVIYMADGWENARGCVIEYEIAKKYGVKIINYDIDSI